MIMHESRKTRKHGPAPRWLRRRFAVKVVALTLSALTSQGIAPSNAMPPHPDLLARIERGEIALPMPLAERDRLLALGVDRPDVVRRFGTAATDSFRTLAILVQYTDQPGQVNAAEFDTLLYETGKRSVRDYYREISYGQLDMVTVDLPSSTGWQSAPQTKTYYANGEYGLGAASYPRNARKLVEDALAAADPIVDFSDYDNDGDGWLDALMIIHTGPGAEFSGNVNDIWSHKWGVTPQSRDGVTISSYAIMPEYWSAPGDITIGVFAHELGHVFGLPDLYDTDGSSQGIGRWSLMASGSWNGSLGNSPAHVDAWCRVQLGFVTPVAPSTSALGAQFPRVEHNPLIYRLWDGGAPGAEFFLVENRQKVGFDAGIPTSGLLIWHIDENVSTSNRNEWYPGYTSNGHYLVALEQADNNFNLEKRQNLGDGADAYPGSTNNRSFNSTSSPNSLAYGGSVSYVAISNISDSDSLMTADLTVSLVSGIGDDTRPGVYALTRNYPNPFNAGTRIEAEVSAPGPVTVTLYDALGRRLRDLTTVSTGPGRLSVDWDGRDEGGVPASSGVYWYRVSGGGLDATTGKMLLLK
jgi:immune inhibitor A